MDLFKLLNVFVKVVLALFQTKPGLSLTKISMLVEASALKKGVGEKVSQSTQCPGSIMSLATFLVFFINMFLHCLL